MTVVSNDPSWWPLIIFTVFYDYWLVAVGVVVVYDWVLTLGQEIELIWRQRWSLMTMLYLLVRYIAIPYSVISALEGMTSVSMTDAECNIMNYAINVTNVVVAAMLCVIMIARLHAMYQKSRIMLIFLVIIFLAVNIACGVITIIEVGYTVGEEMILSGMHMCSYGFEDDFQLFASMAWMLYTVWEVLALCLSVWIAVRHFHDLRRLGPSTGSTIGDCFNVLIKSHMLYFAGFVGVSCLELVSLSPELLNSQSKGAQILRGALQTLAVVQMFVMGPRLILSVREYHAKLVAKSDAEISMSSIVFEEHVHVPTSSTV
jgi:hypothetical protein